MRTAAAAAGSRLTQLIGRLASRALRMTFRPTGTHTGARAPARPHAATSLTSAQLRLNRAEPRGVLTTFAIAIPY